jgi:hypothetical protein
MTWLTPNLAIVAASIAIPTLIILYFLKLRRRDLEISTTLLWKKSIQDLQANAPFQKLRRNILLLLQLLALAAALIAIGTPQLKGDSAVGSRHVIMIDRSASMSARDEKNEAGETISRLEAAKEQAIKLVESLKEPGVFDKASGDQAMLIVFDNTAKAVQTFTSDKDVLKNAIKAITPTDAPTLVDEAFRLARAQAPRRIITDKRPDGTEGFIEGPAGPVGTIHLYSDGRLPDAEKAEASREDVVLFHAIGKPDAANIGITSLRAERSIENSSRLSVFVAMQNTSKEARKVDVEIQVDGQVAAIKPVDLTAATPEGVAATPAAGSPEAPAGQGAPAQRFSPGIGGEVFHFDRPQGGIVSVHAVAPEGDVLATDNSAWIVVPPAKNLAVAIVTNGNLFLTCVMEGLPGGKAPVLFTPDQYEAARLTPRMNEFDVVVLHDHLPKMPEKSEVALPPGKFLILGRVPGGTHGLIDKGEGPPTQFVDWMRDHPALRGVSLDAPTIVKSRLVEIPKGAAARVLAHDANGPAMFELTAPDSKAIVVPFDFMDSDWALNLSFVVFFAQAVQYLGDDSAGLGQMVQPGGVLTDRLPPDATEVRVKLPEGTQADMGAPAPDGTVVYGPVQRAGVYQVSWKGTPGATDAKVGDRAVRPFAANLLDAAESDVPCASNVALANANVNAEASERARVVKQLWPWLLLAAFLVILFEWFVYNRKVQL